MSGLKYLMKLLSNYKSTQDVKKTIIKKFTSPFIKFLPDGLTIKYEGTGLYYMDIAVCSFHSLIDLLRQSKPTSQQ